MVVEGPDGAGKSTLVKHLAEKYDMLEGTRIEKDRDEIWRTTRADSFNAVYAALRYHEPVVWDRLGFWSDPIYAKFTAGGRAVAFTKQELHAMDQLFWNMGWPLIICLPPLTAVMANVNDSHQMEGVNEHILDIYSSYRSLAMVWKGCIIYDYRDNNIETVEFEIENYLQRQKEQYSVIGH